MKDTNYIVILGWMVNQLKLSGNELMAYALIYGFSQDEESKFMGSAQFIGDSLNISRQAVLSLLSKLTEKKLIIKYDRTEKGIKFCDYKTSKEFIPRQESLQNTNKTDLPCHEISNLPCQETLQGVKKLDTLSQEISNLPCQETLQGVKKLDTPCQETLHHIAILKASKAAAAADQSSDQFFSQSEKPPQKAAAVPFDESPPKEDIEKLKSHFKQLNQKLIFDDWFYPEALLFLASHNLDLNFVSWLYKDVAKKKPENITNYLFSVFFKERYVKIYREASKPPPVPEVKIITCPVCSAGFENTSHNCPQCGLETDFIFSRNVKEIDFQKRLFALPSDVRSAYNAEYDDIQKTVNPQNFIEKGRQKKNLMRKYGLVETVHK